MTPTAAARCRPVGVAVAGRAWGCGLAAAVLAVATPVTARADEAPARFAEDAVSGHRFRVSFDPASRVTIGVAAAAGRGPKGAPAAGPSILAGLAFRMVRESGAGRERVTWQVEHRVASGWLRPTAGVPAFDAGLYRASILRHDASPSLVLPTSPPVGIPFPFDVGIDAEAGRVAVSAVSKSAAGPVIHVGVVRAALLLDPWRSGVTGRVFTIGVGARYDLDVDGAPAPGMPRVTHRVAPMTEGSLRLRVESRDGLSVVDAGGEVAPEWSSLGAWALAARASVRLERALLAVNDQPISAIFEGGYRLDPATRAAPAASDFRVSLGLAVNLALSR